MSYEAHRGCCVQSLKLAERDAPARTLTMSLQVEQQHGEAMLMKHPGTLDQHQPVSVNAMHEDDGAS